MFCTHCGSSVEENQKFCNECGGKMENGANHTDVSESKIKTTNKPNFTEYLDAECAKKTGMSSAVLFSKKGKAKHRILNGISCALIAFLIVRNISGGLSIGNIFMMAIFVLVLRNILVHISLFMLDNNLSYEKEIDMQHLSEFLSTNLQLYGFGDFRFGTPLNLFGGAFRRNAIFGNHAIVLKRSNNKFLVYTPQIDEERFGKMVIVAQPIARYIPFAFIDAINQYNILYRTLTLLVISLEYYGKYESNCDIKFES